MILCEHRKFIDIFPREVCAFGNAESENNALSFHAVSEDFEATTFDKRCDLFELESEAEIWFIGTILLHRIFVGEVWEGGLLDFSASSSRFCGFQETALHHRHHILLLDETHLNFKLREFGLAVSALIFITEAARNLEVPVE